MRDLSGRATALETILRAKVRAEEELKSARPPSLELVDLADELENEIREQIRKHNERFRKELLNAINFPPRHRRHFELLEQFWDTACYEKSVFVMTKFPDGEVDAEKSRQLEDVIGAVSDGISAAGFTPRIARGPNPFHPLVWDNIELHLLGCARGVAIVEDRYRQELNPNVAMEWGWMRAMGKPVIYLVERDFEHFRADTEGLIKEPFTWAEPRGTVCGVVQTWLTAEGDAGG